jgi:hypothetical protein
VGDFCLARGQVQRRQSYVRCTLGALPGCPGMRSGRVSSAASRRDDLRQMAHQRGLDVPPKVSSRQTGKWVK